MLCHPAGMRASAHDVTTDAGHCAAAASMTVVLPMLTVACPSCCKHRNFSGNFTHWRSVADSLQVLSGTSCASGAPCLRKQSGASDAPEGKVA